MELDWSSRRRDPARVGPREGAGDLRRGHAVRHSGRRHRGLGEFDIEERRDRSPWVLGIGGPAGLAPARHRTTLLARLEAHAAEHGFGRIWVATGDARTFYQRCGWLEVESLLRPTGERLVVLERRLV